MISKMSFGNNKIKAREKILKDLKKFVVGPDWEDEKEVSIDFDPLRQYASAILFPIQTDLKDASLNLDNDEIEDEDDYEDNDYEEDKGIKSSKQKKEDEGRNDSFTENVIDQSTKSKQSSFGITFITHENELIKVKYGFSKYDKQKKNNKSCFQQKKFIDEIKVEIDLSKKIQVIDQDLLNENNLKLSIRSRKVDKSSNKVISTVALSRIDISDSSDFGECLFHIGMKIECLNDAFLPIVAPAKLGGLDSKRLDLLFRDKKSFSIGSGCASGWEIKENKVRSIYTDFLPSYKIPEIKALDNEELSYSGFANIDNEIDEKEFLESAIELKAQYSSWIKEQIKNAEDIDDDFKEASKINIDEATKWLKRISNGIDLIINNNSVRTAFRLTNHAMAIQFNRYKGLKSKTSNESLKGEENLINDLISNNHSSLKGGWRPFQLAFLLGVIPDINDPENDFRDIVDLIWFPTGGGKTEAYLGVLAFTILLRRINWDGDAGVTAIMRYTLRLLTSDQFRRCSALITALEYIRKTKVLDTDLGKIPISIGLWIGKSASPGSHQEANNEIRKQTRKLPFILNECPWCKTDLITCNTGASTGYVPEKIDGKTKVIIKCPDKNCSFSDSIPVYLWQEAIFEEKPTLLIGTVDNFTKLAWNEIGDQKAQKMLKNNDHHPPELIIQDELHLISGPLGSMVAMYENILLGILEEDGESPKIIGATATLSMGGNQSQSLYRGRDSKIFPPQVLSWGDSYFAEEKEISDSFPGRLYVGYLGGVKNSAIEAAFNIAIPLLQAPQVMLPITLEDYKKGDSELKVTWPDNIGIGAKISTIHRDDARNSDGTYEDYEVIKIVESDENESFMKDFSVKNIHLEKPLEGNLKKHTTLYFIDSDFYDEHQSTWDPYGTLVWYFNAKKELGNVSNQQIRLKERLRSDARYLNKGNLGPENLPTKFSRQINNCEELTGRLDQSDIENIKQNLDINWSQTFKKGQRSRGIDILFATNMISVGVDIPRLGTMLVNGQPRTTAEYIQASSRVGREYPGIVVISYNHTKSRDRSIYETFLNYHQSIYKYVESSSITPYSKGSRDRCLPSVLIGLASAFGIKGPELTPADEEVLNQVKNWILSAVESVDPSEYDDTEADINKYIKEWGKRTPEVRGNMSGNNEGVALIGPPGSNNEEVIFSAPLSMRGSDEETQLKLWGGEDE